MTLPGQLHTPQLSGQLLQQVAALVQQLIQSQAGSPIGNAVGNMANAGANSALASKPGGMFAPPDAPSYGQMGQGAGNMLQALTAAPSGPITGDAQGVQDHLAMLQQLAQQGVPVEQAYQQVFGRPFPVGTEEAMAMTALYQGMANPAPAGPQASPAPGAPPNVGTGGGGPPMPFDTGRGGGMGGPGSGGGLPPQMAAILSGGAPAATPQPGAPVAPGAAPGGPSGGGVVNPPQPGGGGNPTDAYDTGYDPTQGGRSVRNAMAALGLPLIGPMAKRNMEVGSIGLGQALASPGAFANGPGEGGFQSFLTSRMGGQAPGTSNESRIGNLMGLESAANAMLAGHPGGNLQDMVSQGGSPFSDPSQAGQFAYLASIAEDPQALGSAFASQFGGTSLSPGLTNLVGSVLGQILQRQYDAPGSRNQRFAPFSNLRSLFGSVQ